MKKMMHDTDMLDEKLSDSEEDQTAKNTGIISPILW